MAKLKLEGYKCQGTDCTGTVTFTEGRELESIVADITAEKCRWCDTELQKDVIDAYEHDGGWAVYGHIHRLWLSIQCSKCKYDWSLWKVGVPR